jgi:hypothetical protein
MEGAERIDFVKDRMTSDTSTGLLAGGREVE